MILPDHQIHALCEQGMVSPYDRDLCNPCSLDVRLGSTLLIESAQSPELVRYPLEGHTQDRPYWMSPGQFVLSGTLEYVRIPETICAQFALKSSRAREGIEHLLAGWIDSGFWGVITIELHNSRQLHPVALWPGMRIGQLVFSRLASTPARSYAVTGRYHQAQGVEASKG